MYLEYHAGTAPGRLTRTGRPGLPAGPSPRRRAGCIRRCPARPLGVPQMTDPEATRPRRTPLTGVHERLGATLTDFAGWLMPLRYGSELAEHRAVRTAAGLFDLIVYRLADQEYLVVAYAANTGVVHDELRQRAGRGAATVTDQTADYALIAVQGPHAAAILATLTSAELAGLRYYTGHPAEVAGAAALLARTGYTGEDGFEIFVRPGDAERLWAALSEAG